MRITGTYNNYLYLSNLLAPFSGGKAPADLVSQTFLSAMTTYQQKTDLQLFSKNSSSALLQLYGGAADLAGKAAKLTQDDSSSVFNDRTAASSNVKVLTASAYNALSSSTGATEAAYSLSVTDLAQAQKNAGSELTAADASAAGEGTHTFEIVINGKTHQVSIEIAAGDTNEALMQNMATAINALALGVTAAVESGAAEGTHRLVLEAGATGAANAFTLSDATGSAVASTGVGTVSQAAQDASYTVNGTAYNSSSNTILLDSGMVTVNLKGTGSATLTVAPDEAKAQDAVSGFISGINSFIDTLNRNSLYLKDEVLSTITSYLSNHKTALEAIGITQGADGKLTIDSAKLSADINEDMAGIEKAFAGMDGLAVQMKNYTSRIATEPPINYAKETGTVIKDFSDYFSGTSSAMYEQLLLGSLYNGYI